MFLFDQERAKRVRQPIVLVLGSDSEPVWHFHHKQMKEWIPHAEEHIVPGGNHMCLVMHQKDTARALSSFFLSYPIENPDPQKSAHPQENG